MKKIAICLMVTVFFSVNLFAQGASKEKVIAVTAFKNLTGDKKYAWLEIGIADSIALKLRNVPDYIVIDRTNVDKIVNEINLGQSGLIDDKTAKQAGKALNADLLVVGNFQIYGKQVRISAKIVEVESHKVMRQVESTGSMMNIFALQDDIALKIINQSNIAITLDVKNKITQQYTQDVSAYEYYSKGNQYYYKTMYDEAIDMFNKAIKIDKHYSLAYAGLGKAYANLYWKKKNYANIVDDKLLDRSYEFSKKALSISPNLDEAILSMAKYYQNVDENKVKDKWDKCEELTKKAIDVNPNNGEAYFLMSRIYGYDDTKEEMYLHKAISKNQFIADAHNNLGIIYTTQGKYDMAIAAFDKAIEIEPEYKTAYMNKGVVYSRQGLHEKALDLYKVVVEKFPNYPLGLVNLGIGYRKLNQWDEAIKWFRKSVEVKPDYDFGWGEVAYYYLHKNDYKQAINYYKIALKYDAKGQYHLANIGYSYGELGQFNDAIKYLEQCANYHSDYAWPCGHLGWIYRYKLNNSSKALEWYRKALQREPGNSNFQKYVNELSSGGSTSSGGFNIKYSDDKTDGEKDKKGGDLKGIWA